jgi:2-phospho-L-lactate guanylyltransferase
MRTIAILPIKSFGAAKQRLAGMLGSGSRRALAQAMFLDVLASLRRSSAIDSIAVVTGDLAAESAAAGRGTMILPDEREQGQSAAAEIGIEYALRCGYERALLVPGDTPLLATADLADLLDRSAADELGIAIVPDRHGTGTNALLLSPPDAIAPSFGPQSLERHIAAAQASGRPHRVEQTQSLLFDVDTPEDMAVLADLLEQRTGRAPLTRGALAQLSRARARPPAPVASTGA